MGVEGLRPQRAARALLGSTAAVLRPLGSALLVAEGGGDIAYCAAIAEAPGARPLYECTWNHTTLHALKIDRRITYLQVLYPADRLERHVAWIRSRLPSPKAGRALRLADIPACTAGEVRPASHILEYFATPELLG